MSLGTASTPCCARNCIPLPIQVQQQKHEESHQDKHTKCLEKVFDKLLLIHSQFPGEHAPKPININILLSSIVC